MYAVAPEGGRGGKENAKAGTPWGSGGSERRLTREAREQATTQQSMGGGIWMPLCCAELADGLPVYCKASASSVSLNPSSPFLSFVKK